MSNPLFDRFGPQNQNGGPFGNMMNLVNQFNQFKSAFRGDAQQTVQELLNSGQMTQAQFNQLSQMANQLQRMMKG